MRSFDLEMLTYLKLAELSRQKRHAFGSDKFLVLVGVAACRAGYLAIADRCRDLIVQHQPRHVLARYATFADALRDGDFSPLAKRLEKLCPFEEAEFLAQQWGIMIEPNAKDAASDIEAEALAILSHLEDGSQTG